MASQDGDNVGVLIVGAGPVGLFTALKLCRANLPVTVIEKEEQVLNTPRAIAYAPPCVAELDRVGILEDVKKIGRLGYWRGYRTLDGRTLAENNYGLNEGHMKYPFPAYCGQHELAAIITRHCKQNPKFKLEFNTEMVGLEQNDSGVSVTVKDVKTGETRVIKAKYLVGADGGKSTVRKSIGIQLEGFTWDETFVATNIMGFPFHKYKIRGANFIVHPKHWAVVAQTGGDNSPWRIAFGIEKGLTPEEVRKRAPEHLKILLPGPDPYELVQCNQYSVHQRCASTYKVGKVLLAGDAAHLNNPIGGFGLTTGITDAACLGDALVAVLQGLADDSLLQTYADLRRKVFLEISNPRSIEAKRKAQSDPDNLSDADKEFYRRMNEDDQFQIEGMKGSMVLQTLLDIPAPKLEKESKEVNGEVAGV